MIEPNKNTVSMHAPVSEVLAEKLTTTTLTVKLELTQEPAERAELKSLLDFSEAPLLKKGDNLDSHFHRAESLPNSLNRARSEAVIDIYFLMNLMIKAALTTIIAARQEAVQKMNLINGCSDNARHDLLRSARSRFCGEMVGAGLGVAGGAMGVGGGFRGLGKARNAARTAGLHQHDPKNALKPAGAWTHASPTPGAGHTPNGPQAAAHRMARGNPLHDGQNPRSANAKLAERREGDAASARQQDKSEAEKAGGIDEARLREYNHLMEKPQTELQMFHAGGQILQSTSQVANASGNFVAADSDSDKILHEAEGATLNSLMGMTNEFAQSQQQALKEMMDKMAAVLQCQQQTDQSRAQALAV